MNQLLMERKVLNLENNNEKDNENLVEQTYDIKVTNDGTTINDVEHVNQNLTNEQKLKYLSKLIQKAYQELETNGINKNSNTLTKIKKN